MSAEGVIWTERFRPESLDDVIGHEQSVERLKKYVDDPSIPHMLFAGPPGTGKTAATVAFARDVFGPSWKSNMMEMNASDERGIDTIRDKVKRFARSSPVGEAPYQIIFLDEADQLTKAAQASLRRIMEEYSDGTRFFLTCNYPNQIIEAIQSRCSVFRFGRLSDEEIRSICNTVIEREGLEVSDEAFEIIVQGSNGDARKVINTLQQSAFGGKITEDTVSVASNAVDDSIVAEIIDLSISGNADEAMEMLDTEFLKEGVNSNLLGDAFLRVLKSRDMPGSGKMKAISKLGTRDQYIREGGNESIQWHALLSDIFISAHLTFGKYDGEQK